MEITLHTRLTEIPAAEWNALAGGDPFLRHEFLAALERHHCVGPRYGWLPRHLAARDTAGRLVGAVPLYLKDNSYGEFVFDWAWADAYERHGLPYYPKLVAAVPYTPATGARLLIAPACNRGEVADALVSAALEYAHEWRVSSLHWLFTHEEDTRHLERHGLLRRTGCQFHWKNNGYRDFDDFLAGFSAEKRKKLKRERRRVAEAGVEIEVVHGHEMTEPQWSAISEFYRSTFLKKGGTPTLSRAFFEDIGRTMGENIVIVLARHEERYVAGAISLKGDDTLYGRHWGCSEEFHSLHFEVCYYQGIEYCIRHGLQRFEPGAQGEHKVMRGFFPTPTYSTHWIGHEPFQRAIADFLVREQRMVHDYMDELRDHLPFKEDLNF